MISGRSHTVDEVDKLLPGQMPGIDSDRDIVSSIDDELGDGVPVRRRGIDRVATVDRELLGGLVVAGIAVAA